MLSPTALMRGFARSTVLSSPRALRRGRVPITPTKAAAAAAGLGKSPRTPKTPQSPAASDMAPDSPSMSIASPHNRNLRGVAQVLRFDIDDGREVAYTAEGLAAAVETTVAGARADKRWQHALDQLRELLPHSERLNMWQQHAALLLACADLSLQLGEAAQAVGYATDVVEYHASVACDGASMHARVLAAHALDKSGRRAEAEVHLKDACNMVTQRTFATRQTGHDGKVTCQVDTALPFLEYARHLERWGAEGVEEQLLTAVSGLRQASAGTMADAHTKLAQLYASAGKTTEADRQFDHAIAKAPTKQQQIALLGEAASFAQHKLRSVAKAVEHYTKLFHLRPPMMIDSASASVRDAEFGELLLNAGTCFEQHPAHGCAASVALYRAALSHFAPDATHTLRLRLYLARAYSGSGQVDRALEEYTSVVNQLKSSDPGIQMDINSVKGYLPLCEVHGHLGLCLYQRAGDTVGALEQYQNAFEVASKMDEAQQTSIRRTIEWLHEGMGALCLRIGLVDDAINNLEEKIKLASFRNDPAVDAHLHVACAYESTGRPNDAREVYEFLFALPESATTREQRVELTLRHAWLSHYTLGDFDAAVMLYLAALHMDADNPHTMVQAAWCMLQLDQVDFAEVEALYVSAALAVEMTRQQATTASTAPAWDTCYVLGECAVFHHDYTKKTDLAQELYEAALTVTTGDNYAQVAANYAVFLHNEKKDAEAAQQFFERAMESNPNLPNAATLYADFLMQTNQLSEAMVVLDQLRETNRSEALHRMARIAERTVTEGSYDKAIAGYCRALRSEDAATDDVSDEVIIDSVKSVTSAQLAIANDLVALLQYKTRRHALVEKLYDILLKRFPQEVHLLMHHAKFCVDTLKKRKLAQRTFRRAVALEPANVTLLDHYAEFLSSTYPDRLDAAEAVHLQSIRLNPRSPQAHFSFASFLTYIYPAPERAEEHFKAALKLDPRDSVTLCCYATFLENQAESRGRAWEHFDSAVSYADSMYREAIRLAPNNASHATYFANFLWRQRRHPEAWVPFAHAINLEPGNAAHLRLAGMFLHDWHTLLTLGSAAGQAPGPAAIGVPVGAAPDGSSSSTPMLAADKVPPVLRTVVSEAPTTPSEDALPLPTDSSGDLEQPVAIAELCERAFRRALQLAPTDTLTLRSFAKFMEDVRRDPAAATRLENAAMEYELLEHDAVIAAQTEELDSSDPSLTGGGAAVEGRPKPDSDSDDKE